MPSRRERLADEIQRQNQLGDLEYKMHIAMAISNDDLQCACYLVDNRERLLTVIVANAIKNQEDADVAVHRFVKGVHNRHSVDGVLLVSEEREQHARK